MYILELTREEVNTLLLALEDRRKFIKATDAEASRKKEAQKEAYELLKRVWNLVSTPV